MCNCNSFKFGLGHSTSCPANAPQKNAHYGIDPKPKLKVGDRVRPIQDFKVILKTDVGTIIGIKNEYYVVKWDATSGPLKLVGPMGITDNIVYSEFGNLELVTETRVSECECGNKNNPRGQGHSDWCKLYRREF